MSGKKEQKKIVDEESECEAATSQVKNGEKKRERK